MYIEERWRLTSFTPVEKYGHPSKFGFKDVIHEWKAAERWDPNKLLALYKGAGAQYFVGLANHHDNFDNYDSKYQPWNSVRLGPKKDLIGGWARAARSTRGMKFGVSIHAAHAWMWYEVAQGADTSSGRSPGGCPLRWQTHQSGRSSGQVVGRATIHRNLYAQNHTAGDGRPEHGASSGTGRRTCGIASVPDVAYCERFYNRTVDLIE